MGGASGLKKVRVKTSAPFSALIAFDRVSHTLCTTRHAVGD